MNVAANNQASSSVLPMLPAHSAAASSANYVATEQVQVHRLDTVWNEVIATARRPFLKVDVQGFDRQVLDGAAGILEQVVGVQIETSFTPLYKGSPLWDETFERMMGMGFEIFRIDPGFTDQRTGRMLQADVTFYRVD